MFVQFKKFLTNCPFVFNIIFLSVIYSFRFVYGFTVCLYNSFYRVLLVKKLLLTTLESFSPFCISEGPRSEV